MRSLIEFIRRRSAFFIFCLLEGIALFLYVQHNYIPRSEVAQLSSLVFGRVYTWMSSAQDYLYLAEQNERLHTENLQLRNSLPQSYETSKANDLRVKDSLGVQRYRYRAAKVVNKSLYHTYNFITLEKGKADGITQDMAVLSPDGVVGLIYGVSEHFSTVMPIIHKNFRLSSLLKRSGAIGSLTWDATDYRYAQLTDIALHTDVAIGDTVVVSGYSDAFPEGIMIGTVETISDKTGSFFHIDVKLNVDFSTIRHVYVVEDIRQAEKRLLESQFIKE